jgi:ribose transport system substrate-binding protein
MPGASPVRSTSDEEVDDETDDGAAIHGRYDVDRRPTRREPAARGGDDYMKRTRITRAVAALGAIALIAGACGANNGGGDNELHVGVSNTLQGNGWREQMICSINAEAKASGKVTKVTTVNRNTDTAGQIEDLRTLISADVDIIILNPTSDTALDPVIKEATDKGITVVAVDQGVNQANAYVLSNDQENYGYLGAKWLFEKLNGSGNVVYMRGIDGVPADSDRDVGFKRALAEFPGITIIKETFTGWDPAVGAQQIQDIFTSGIDFDGIWTSGIDIPIVEAFKQANRPFVPIVGADNNKFVSYLDSEAANGLVGAAVTNPPPVGGAGLNLALKVKAGETIARVTKLTPEVWDNTTDAGKATIKAAVDPELNDYYGVTYNVPAWSSYTKADLIACQAPGA